MKHVLLINQYAVPPTSAGGTRHFSLAKWLLPQGWRMTIVAAGVIHQTGQDRLAAHERIRVERLDDVDFVWIKTRNETAAGLARMLGMLQFSWRVVRRVPTAIRQMPRPDVVIGSSVHPFAALAGWVLSCRYRVPFLFEVRDLWPETLVTLGKLKRWSPLAQLLYALEKFLFWRATAIISPLPGMAPYLERRIGSAQKYRWIPNGIDLAAADRNRESPSPLPPAPWQHLLLYAGAMGNANDLTTLLAAFARFEQAHPEIDVGLRLVGDGPAKPQLQRLAPELGIRKIEFFPSVPRDAVAAVLRSAEGLVITVPYEPELYQYGICSNKLFDYMAAERPTLIANSAVNDPIRESSGGISVAAGDVEALAQAMAQLIELDQAEQSRLGAQGRDYVAKHHDFRAISERLAECLDACIKGRERHGWEGEEGRVESSHGWTRKYTDGKKR